MADLSLIRRDVLAFSREIEEPLEPWHSSIQITMDRYGHLLPGLDDALAAGLEAAYTGGASAEEAAELRGR